ncbi:putative bifunctional diguanylate cyclase/phosphodiesterase [Alkalicoccus daliensis]|uniref:PAS domain S-box-containing protein/diguanylate cyclase (GGDEF) domain-containing protein n=1 Tax=Alkalicoccus daliensis TaxID=745820 RepID=A0A1H0E0W7_9BACI|nr:EAL domain-containing protein [Alkalicoccus daliensis]SDN75881.1 PAS domain S-box-containing protein/diguanylate cyclase (GGDEF) domain-containing protein [Alkalicoccus daliensis]
MINNQSILDTMRQRIFIVEEDGTVESVNKAAQSWSEQERIDNYFTHLQQKASIKTIESFKEVTQGKSSFCEFQYSEAENSRITVRVYAMQDQKKHAPVIVEEQRDENYEQFAEHFHLLDNMSDAFYTLDEDFIFTSINKAAEEQLHVSRDDIVGKNIWDMFPEAAGSRLEEFYLLAAANEKAYKLEYYFEPVDAWLKVHIYPRSRGGLFIFFQNLNEIKKSETKLWESVNYDSLTGLPNRKYMSKMMTNLIEEQSPFTLLNIDLNDFQLINDVYGHYVGDQLLNETARRLQESFSEEIIGRFGGDELALIVLTDNSAEIKEKADIISEILQLPYKFEENIEITVTGSMSAAKFPQDGGTSYRLISAADAAMKEAKQKKYLKENIYFYRSELTEQMRRQLSIEKDMKSSISTNDFFLVYQPQINTETEKISGMEVLTRWKHPKLGFIPPPEFIAAAERTGQLQYLTEKIIEAGINQLISWRNKYSYQGTIAFNVPSSLLKISEFQNFLICSKEDNQIPDHVIEVEITEDMDLVESVEINSYLQQLRKKGFIIAIDDFGTGYSKINYLTKFPFDKIKIDKCFIDEIGSSLKGEAVLKAVISLGRSLGLTVVAEGVETQLQKLFLHEAACELIQGYFYDPPQTVENMTVKLAQGGEYALL